MRIVGEEVLGSKEWSGVIWDENTTKMLDYACGTGLISRVCLKKYFPRNSLANTYNS